MAERWQPGSPPIDATAFATLVATEPYLVIHFWAEWDGYDHQLEAAIKPVRAEFADRVAFRSADTDAAELVPVCWACGVVNVPSLSCFVHGQRVCTLVGVRTTVELRHLVSGLIAGGRMTEVQADADA